MTKIYLNISKYLILCILGLLSSVAVKAAITPTAVYDFSPSSLNTSYVDSEGNMVTIKTNEPATSQFEYFSDDLVNPLLCAGEILPTNKKYTRLAIKGKASAKTPASPYILFSLSDGHTYNKIQILGYGLGSDQLSPAQMICAFSKTGTTDVSFNLKDDNFLALAKSLNFAVNDCNNFVYDIPVGTKHIMLISKDAFAYIGSSVSRSVELHAIRLFTPNSVTGIAEVDHESNNQFCFVHKGDVLEFVEPADIIVYNLHGSKVLDGYNTQEIAISTLPKGLYLVKSKSLRTGAMHTKKILR